MFYFIIFIFYQIDLATHGAYKGGLDARSTGKSAPYYMGPNVELIFHDISRMPTTDDVQQIHKVFSTFFFFK
jgi:hypothetical protein